MLTSLHHITSHACRLNTPAHNATAPTATRQARHASEPAPSVLACTKARGGTKFNTSPGTASGLRTHSSRPVNPGAHGHGKKKMAAAHCHRAQIQLISSARSRGHDTYTISGRSAHAARMGRCKQEAGQSLPSRTSRARHPKATSVHPSPTRPTPQLICSCSHNANLSFRCLGSLASCNFFSTPTNDLLLMPRIPFLNPWHRALLVQLRLPASLNRTHTLTEATSMHPHSPHVLQNINACMPQSVLGLCKMLCYNTLLSLVPAPLPPVGPGTIEEAWAPSHSWHRLVFRRLVFR